MVRSKEKRGEIITDPVRVKAFNFRLVKSDTFPDCCFVCTKASMEYEWEINCSEGVKGKYVVSNSPLVTDSNYPKVWHVCDKFIRDKKIIFEKQ